MSGSQVVVSCGEPVDGGQFENQQRAMKRLMVIGRLVLLLIVGFLYGSFGNARQAPFW